MLLEYLFLEFCCLYVLVLVHAQVGVLMAGGILVFTC